MVAGKSGDTAQTKPADTTVMLPTMLQILQSGKEYNNGNTKIIKTANGNYISYKEQNADGIIGTAKSAVDISINLILPLVYSFPLCKICNMVADITVVSAGFV